MYSTPWSTPVSYVRSPTASQVSSAIVLSSVVQDEYVVIQASGREVSVEDTQRQGGDFVRNKAIRILVDDSYLVSLGVTVRRVVRELSIRCISLVDDAWILHCQVVRRLEIYIGASEKGFQISLEEQPVHCTYLPTATEGGDSALRRHLPSTKPPPN